MEKREEYDQREKAELKPEYDAKKLEAEEAIINGLIDYVKEGIFPKTTPEDFLICYNFAYTFADKGYGEEILNYHNDKIKEAADYCYEKIKNLVHLDFIDSFIIKTNNLFMLIKVMANLFSYMTNSYLVGRNDNNPDNKEDYKNICEFSMKIYKESFYNKLEQKLFAVLNQLIKEERNGNLEYRQKICNIIETISFLDFEIPIVVKKSDTKIIWQDKLASEHEIKYQEKWFNNYKKETEAYSKEKAKKDIHNNSAPEYVSCEIKYLNEEKLRQECYLNKIYHHIINDINYKYIIKDNTEELANMDSGIRYMFKTKKIEELTNVYILFSLFEPSLDIVQKLFREYIKERGNTLYGNKELSGDPRKFIPELINLKKEMDKLVDVCFQNHKNFQENENRAFYQFMTKDIYARQLSNYVDFCMRIGFKGKSEEEIENTLNDIISIFKNLNSKLVFQNDSDKKMSARLIKNSSLSINTEKLFISKLKQENGVSYVSKKNEMINDLEKNKNEIEGYKSSSSNGVPNGIKFNVTVISQSAWEINKNNMEKFVIPPSLNFCIKDFEDFYFKRHQTMKLLWCLGLSKLDIQFLYLKTKYISTSTLPQLLCLLNLEKYQNSTIENLSSLLGCSVQTLLADIQGLIFNISFNPKGLLDKGVILANIDPKTKEFKPSTEISINMNFTSTRPKFNTISLPQKKTASELQKNEEEEAKIIKKYQENILQATLTRIMKSRIGQDTTHVWLVGETSKQVDLFKAQPQQIKENIEKLIEKNIIKRNGSNYEYIA